VFFAQVMTAVIHDGCGTKLNSAGRSQYHRIVPRFVLKKDMTQKEALEILKSGSNIYLTGSAGSGKTYLLDMYITFCRWRGKNVAVTASTGVAATHLSGQTINSWAGIGIKNHLTDADVEELVKRRYLHDRFRKTQVLVIDEVSMLSASMLASVDKVLRVFRKNDAPFGGIQVILCGDFFQLPPVSSANATLTTEYIFKSPIWHAMDLQVCYLDKPFRQEDKRFLRMLSEIRSNSITKVTWGILKERFFQTFPGAMTPTKLYTHNAHADAVNIQELAKIKNAEHIYEMESEGVEGLTLAMKKSCLAPQKLVLKKGSLVMFVKNNFDEGYVNGTMGRVVDFTEKEQYPIVEIFSGEMVKAEPAIWEIEEDGRITARIKQIPLRLAWGITIHKSQGMSLDAAEIDLGKSFVEGLGYVALSRVRKLEGIKLKSINRTALSVNDEVIKLDKTLRMESDKTSRELKSSYWYRKNEQT
jgi:ATP-dependent DNA helicase PIF1